MEDKQPFQMEFDGELIVRDGPWLMCKEKNVKVVTELLLDFIKKKRPLGEKKLVGTTIEPIISNGVTELHDGYCYMWRDEKFTHIGCLKERTDEFNKKYIQLIKHLNNKNVNTQSSGGSANNK